MGDKGKVEERQKERLKKGKKEGDKGRVGERQKERLQKGKKGGDKVRVGERQGERLTMEDLRMVENMTNIQLATFREELDFDVPELRNQAN